MARDRDWACVSCMTCLLWGAAPTAAGLDLGGDEGRPAHGEAEAPALYLRPELLLETPDLAALYGENGKCNDPKLVLLDARPRAEYLIGHLFGARNLESDPLQDETHKPGGLVKAAALAKLAGEHGVHADSRIVVYDAQGGRLAARVWFTFWAHGFDRVALLNGGIPKWKAESRPLSQTTGSPPEAQGTWEPREDALRGVCALSELLALKPAPTPPGQLPPTTILDARTYQEYKGDDARAKAAGHVPGAVNMPWDVLLKPVTVPAQGAQGAGAYLVWREAPQIHALLRAAGLTRTKTVAVYDQSGGRSAHLFFTLLLMGFEKPVNYANGWREYGNRDDVEVER